MNLTPSRVRQCTQIMEETPPVGTVCYFYFNIQIKRGNQWLVNIQRISIDELHHYSMSVIIHRFGNWKASIVQCLGLKRRQTLKSSNKTVFSVTLVSGPEQTLTHLVHYLHVGKLLHGREAGEIEPGHVLPMFVIISLVLQIPERCTPQPVQLQSILLSAWTRHNIYIYMQGEQKERNIYINMST